MKVKELIKLLGFFNRESNITVNGQEIEVSYSVNQDGEWTTDIHLKPSPNKTAAKIEDRNKKD